MGSQRAAAVAAVSHAKYYHNHTQPATPNEASYNVNVLFVSATLCGVLVAVCAACWRRAPREDKPDDTDCQGVYTVSSDCRLSQVQMEPGPPPAYETVVDGPPDHKDCLMLQEVVTDVSMPCQQCLTPGHCDELPTYEAAVKLKDTKL